MRCLIAEDDFTARKLLQMFLSEVGECSIAVNGQEAVAAFEQALDQGMPYDLVCLDIMMPEMDGQQALEAIRQIEEARGIGGLDGVKVVITTGLRDSKYVMNTFRIGCEAYIVKPVKKAQLLAELEKLGLPVECV